MAKARTGPSLGIFGQAIGLPKHFALTGRPAHPWWEPLIYHGRSVRLRSINHLWSPLHLRTEQHGLPDLSESQELAGNQVEGSLLLSPTAIADPLFSTTTDDPTGTRLYRSMMSWLKRRMQPLETACPMDHGSVVPWRRYNVSLSPS